MLRRAYHQFSRFSYGLQAKFIIHGQNLLNKTLYFLDKEKYKVYFEKPLNQKYMLVLAIYEKNNIRKDIIRLANEMRKNDVYILCINNARIDNKNEIEGLFDCYIERFNYGRDFGCYKQGVEYIIGKKWEERLERIIFLNDSIFFSKRQLPEFVKKLVQARACAVGATENFEFNYHLGSFCLSFDSKLFKHPKFRKFWQSYRLTDIRPRVIRKGEIRLTKILMQCCPSNEVKSLYNAAQFEKFLEKDENLDFCLSVKMKPRFSWPIFDLDHVIGNFTQDYFGERFSLKDLEDIEFAEDVEDKTDHQKLLIEGEKNVVLVYGKKETKKQKILADRIESIVRLIEKRFHIRMTERQIETLKRYIVADLVRAFRAPGSQIHKNAPHVLKMGCAIIKLDGLYRGVFDDVTILQLLSLMDEEDAPELKALLYQRPYGLEVLTRWKQAAFRKGYI